MPSSQFAVGLVLLLWIITTVSAALDFPVTIGETAFSLRMEVYGEASIRATLLPLTGWSYTVDHVIVAKPADGLLRRVGKDSACVKDYCLRVIRDEASIELVYIRHGTPLTHAVVKDVTSPNIRAVFPRALTLYGLPEHAADLPLRQDHTYELYNTDAFQYPLNKTSALYGAIPFVMAYATNQSTGLLWLNSAEMNVRIESGQLPSCDWKAEVGPVDLFFIPGPTPAEVQRNHAQLTGPTMLPPYFSLGYHQCRWNYMSTQDCHGVDESMDEGGFPYDVLWLDIEHTDKKKYFTWDTYNFPNVTELTSFLSAKGRKLVTIKDPHVKRDGSYALHIEATQHGHYIKDSKGGDFTGDCWPGASSWPDFFNRRTREWYSRWFHDDKYPGGSRDIHTWVDMNEPSVFRGAKGTMDKAAMHELDDGHVVEHRQVHNMYGHMNLIAADKGMREAGGEDAQPERPFILTRSFFPGSQRLAAMWTGDNAGRWDHLDLTSAELLSLSISNYPFCGCDVGGFFHDPEEELFVRWMQAGAFYPFFRAHAHIDTRRREPFRFSPDGQRVMRDALALRYALIPYLYTVFYDAHRFGNTILRPLFFEFPEQEALREEQRTYMFGPSVLVRPVMEKGAKEVSVVLPAKTQWYRYPSGEAVSGASYTMPVDMSTIPVFFRGGHIIPMKLRLRRSTLAARFDPFTLYVCLDAEGRGAGELYVDDGTTFDYEQGSYAFRSFTFADGKLSSSIHKDAHGSIFSLKNEVERIIILGLPQHRHVLSVHVMSTRDGFAVGDSLPFVRNSLMVEVLINTPLCVADDFTLHFEFAV